MKSEAEACEEHANDCHAARRAIALTTLRAAGWLEVFEGRPPTSCDFLVEDRFGALIRVCVVTQEIEVEPPIGLLVVVNHATRASHVIGIQGPNGPSTPKGLRETPLPQPEDAQERADAVNESSQSVDAISAMMHFLWPGAVVLDRELFCACRAVFVALGAAAPDIRQCRNQLVSCFGSTVDKPECVLAYWFVCVPAPNPGLPSVPDAASGKGAS